MYVVVYDSYRGGTGGDSGIGTFAGFGKMLCFRVFFRFIVLFTLVLFFGISGIVPAIIAHTFSIWVVTVSLGRKMKIKPVKMSWTETYRQGKNIASLGIYMTVSGFVTTLYSYLFVAWLNDRGGTGEVGFFKRVIRWSCSMWGWFLRLCLWNIIPVCRLSARIKYCCRNM